MANCNITKGRTIQCKSSIGGLHKAWLGDWGTLSGATVRTVDDVITSLGTVTLFEYELKNNSNTFTQAIASSRDNGVSTFTQTLNLSLIKMDAATNMEIKLLAYGNPQIIIQSNNGDCQLLGYEFGMDLISGNALTGGNKTDKNGYDLVFEGVERQLAYFLSGSTISAPFGMVGGTITITKGS